MIVFRRNERAKLSLCRDHFKRSTRGLKGLRPELCPAVKDFHSSGFLIYSPFEIKIQSKFSFNVAVYTNIDEQKLLVPGIIGTPGSPRFYARVDTGFSLLNSECEILSIPNLLCDEVRQTLIIPPVIYPAGYTGPILIAVSADQPFQIDTTLPLLHLIPLSREISSVKVEDTDVRHTSFEGLIYKDFNESFSLQKRCSSLELIGPILPSHQESASRTDEERRE